MKKKINCTVIGDAMIDVVLPLTNVKDIYSLSQGGVTNTKMRLSSGGAANVAFYIRELGASSAFIGKVGDDYFGKMFLNDLKKNGVTANVSVSKTENTGIVFVLVFPDGQRFFIDDRGANANLKYEDIKLGLIRNSECLYLLGFSFQDEETISSIKRVLEEVSKDILIVFNPGAPNLAKEFRKSFTNVVREYVSILILNEAEAKYLTECSSESEIIDSLLSLADTVAMTKGDRGSTVARQNEVYDIKGNPVRALDTTGAGDAYAAGFIYALSHDWDIKTAGEFASRIAGEVVSHFGARVNLSNLSF